MMSLFSSFDIYFNMIPLFSFILFFVMTLNNLYKINSNSLVIQEMKSLSSFFLSLKPLYFSKVTLIFIFIFMITIMMVNFISVFPFSFPFTSQFGPIFMSGLSIWMSFIIFMGLNNVKGLLLHLIPEGSPMMLTFLLFLIEMVSNMIRPITLSVRLVANILAGHLLMILLSKLIFLNSFLFPFYMLLNLVEIFVAIIQSYIFCTMISLYFSEIH